MTSRSFEFGAVQDDDDLPELGQVASAEQNEADEASFMQEDPSTENAPVEIQVQDDDEELLEFRESLEQIDHIGEPVQPSVSTLLNKILQFYNRKIQREIIWLKIIDCIWRLSSK